MTQRSSAARIDSALDTLSDASRRELLRSLSTRGPEEPLERDELAGDGGHAIELVHVHLPKLEDEGFVDWDRETGAVRRGSRFEEAEPILEAIRDPGRRED